MELVSSESLLDREMAQQMALGLVKGLALKMDWGLVYPLVNRLQDTRHS